MQCNGHVEKFNRSLVAILRCFVDDNPMAGCLYVPVLFYSCNMNIHLSTGTTPFYLVLILPTPKFMLDEKAPRERAVPIIDRHEDYKNRLRVSFSKEKLHWTVHKSGTTTTSKSVFGYQSR